MYEYVIEYVKQSSSFNRDISIRPMALEIEHADELVRRLQEDAAERGERLAPTAAVEIATAWRDELAQLEESARLSMVPALRVRMDGAFNEQMTELLAALSLC